MTVKEATEYLSQFGITNNEQVVRRWIREGRFKAEMKNKKEGYKVSRTSLQAYVRKTIGLDSVISKWRKENEAYKRKERETRKELTKTQNELRQVKKDRDQAVHLKTVWERKYSEAMNSNDSWFNKFYPDENNQEFVMFRDKKTTRKIFRKMLAVYHPDNQDFGDEEIFKIINEVYRKNLR